MVPEREPEKRLPHLRKESEDEAVGLWGAATGSQVGGARCGVVIPRPLALPRLRGAAAICGWVFRGGRGRDGGGEHGSRPRVSRPRSGSAGAYVRGYFEPQKVGPLSDGEFGRAVRACPGFHRLSVPSAEDPRYSVGGGRGGGLSEWGPGARDEAQEGGRHPSAGRARDGGRLGPFVGRAQNAEGSGGLSPGSVVGAGARAAGCRSRSMGRSGPFV